MTKELTAKVGEFTNNNGETKGRYVRIGVLLSNQNGEYMLLDPTVDLAGVLSLQNQHAHANGKKISDRVMVSVFDKDRQQNNQQRGAPAGGGSFDDEIPF